MSYYTIETWTIRNVAKAFNFKNTSTDETDLKVVIPIFQRGLRWEPERRRTFIDSLERGYPFGSLLFAKQEGINKFSVVDGLQRGSTVCDYVYNPLAKDNITSIDDDTLTAIRHAIFPENDNKSMNSVIEKIILDYFHEKKQFDNVQLMNLAGIIYDNFPNGQDKFELAEKIQNAILPFFKAKKERYNSICDSNVPIVMYSGPQDLLSDIFNRINTKGIALNDFEIYAATWSQKRYKINNLDVVQKVVNKYLSIIREGFTIDNFNAEAMLSNGQLTAFEFLFGLGKYWNEKFDCLKLDSKNKEDEVNEISFEIVDACISSSKSIAKLDKTLQTINLNKLQRRIEEAITFVSNSIAIVGSFKGNKRKYKVLHSKYQIVSLISFTFREMYDINDLDHKKANWNDIQTELSKRLLRHYVADIITNDWHDGGAGKVYSFNRDKKYDEDITVARWNSLLDNYYQTQLQNKQNERFANPVNADSVILNCIYVNLFSAADHLSSQMFDIEHLATKERMKSILKKFDGLKLPVSCIANFCYLPESINRGKKDKTIYEVPSLVNAIPEIEDKYSFTKEEDLKWIAYPYEAEDKELLISNFQKYLDKRYAIIKKKFLDCMTCSD